jgi:hypothetical protein
VKLCAGMDWEGLEILGITGILSCHRATAVGISPGGSIVAG